MLAVGLMSGTSLDGMDAALVRFTGPTHATLIDFVTRPYSDAERAVLRQALDPAPAPRQAERLAHLHVQLAHWAAEAVEAVLAQARIRASDVALIAFPGQTIW